MGFNTSEIGVKLALFYVPFLFALCFHEYAHGWMARRKGDDTALIMGRLTMNPLAHMDLVGTFLIPMFVIITGSSFFFGWAKPVPVNSRNLKNVKKDMFWIAIAGPLSNVILAAIGSVLLSVSLTVQMQDELLLRGIRQFFVFFIQINLMLAFFNMLPFHPLDGAKVLARFLPFKWNYWLEQNQGILQIVLIMLMFTGAFHYIAVPVKWASDILVNSSFAMAGIPL